jgi:hypothetical protein
MNYNGQKLDTNTARYIALIKELERDALESTGDDCRPASLLQAALPPSEPPPVRPTVADDDTYPDDEYWPAARFAQLVERVHGEPAQSVAMPRVMRRADL